MYIFRRVFCYQKTNMASILWCYILLGWLHTTWIKHFQWATTYSSEKFVQNDRTSLAENCLSKAVSVLITKPVFKLNAALRSQCDLLNQNLSNHLSMDDMRKVIRVSFFFFFRSKVGDFKNGKSLLSESHHESTINNVPQFK